MPHFDRFVSYKLIFKINKHQRLVPLIGQHKFCFEEGDNIKWLPFYTSRPLFNSLHVACWKSRWPLDTVLSAQSIPKSRALREKFLRTNIAMANGHVSLARYQQNGVFLRGSYVNFPQGCTNKRLVCVHIPEASNPLFLSCEDVSPQDRNHPEQQPNMPNILLSLLMVRSKSGELTSWYGKYIPLFHKIHKGVSWNGGTPNLHPKMIIFSRKTHGCWGNPPF